MTSCKTRRFRAIFARNFPKIHTFFMKYWYFSESSCDKKNLKWIFISYGIYETRCVFYIPSPKARGYKTHNSFHKYRMKWKFISDPIWLGSPLNVDLWPVSVLVIGPIPTWNHGPGHNSMRNLDPESRFKVELWPCHYSTLNHDLGDKSTLNHDRG